MVPKVVHIPLRGQKAVVSIVVDLPTVRSSTDEQLSKIVADIRRFEAALSEADN